MSLHGKPKTPAEHLALHLETIYGLQLDPIRHKALCAELEAFGLWFVATKQSSAFEQEQDNGDRPTENEGTHSDAN